MLDMSADPDPELAQGTALSPRIPVAHVLGGTRARSYGKGNAQE